MDPVTLSPQQARKIILHAAGLAKRSQFGKGKEAVVKLISHLGFIQIDTNYVVERAHHHAIFSRVPDYRPEWVDQLQADGRLFEFWHYATGYIPMDDFRFSLPVKESFLSQRKPLTQIEINLMTKVLDRIGREGPLMARDFENDRITKSSGWWDWRPSKVALERLHLSGKLMTIRKSNFQKVYDLSENVLPRDVDITPPTTEEYARHVIHRVLKAMGIAHLKVIYWSTRFVNIKSAIKVELEKMVAAGDVLKVAVTGLKGAELYMLPEYRNKKISLSNDAFILSPFDTLTVYRHRLRDFFDFDYQVECFVPAPKRKYGYFSLPILIGDTFVARMDAKADRKERIFVINNLHFEKIKLSRQTIAKILDALKEFVKFNQCDRIVVKKCNNKEMLGALKSETAKGAEVRKARS
ncbi:MAG TPA: crosslink repair DNA glycosylase YcaQ family protein [Cyclobacteriaceae bacterium]|nr:crosslink repair DNA glycosylase YcaQ family protein [Cyclobacteriaceae bacterium]